MAYVMLKVTGRLGVEVPDNLSIEEAKRAANFAAQEADFGELSEIDWEAIYHEDENGNHHDF